MRTCRLVIYSSALLLSVLVGFAGADEVCKCTYPPAVSHAPTGSNCIVDEPPKTSCTLWWLPEPSTPAPGQPSQIGDVVAPAQRKAALTVISDLSSRSILQSPFVKAENPGSFFYQALNRRDRANGLPDSIDAVDGAAAYLRRVEPKEYDDAEAFAAYTWLTALASNAEYAAAFVEILHRDPTTVLAQLKGDSVPGTEKFDSPVGLLDIFTAYGCLSFRSHDDTQVAFMIRTPFAQGPQCAP